MTTPAAAGFTMPAEAMPHTRCWMAWPCRPATFGGSVTAATTAYAQVAQAIAAFEPLTMVCNPGDVAAASLACGAGIDVLPLAISDSWIRDNGPTFVTAGDGRIAGVHWRFNAWGNNYPDHAADARAGRGILDHLGLPCYEAPFVLEGGAFHVDGEGTLLTTEQCLLNPNRNPGLSKPEIEALLRDHLGIRSVVWLGQGYEDDETDGHIDEIACFVRPGVVLALVCDDPGDANFAILQDNLDRLEAARDAQGRAFEVIPVRQPARQDFNGTRLTLSYTNFYPANGGIVMPAFGDPADHAAFQTLSRVFPDRRVVQVDALDIVRGGGGIHCITQQQPRTVGA
ncbi:MAG: agmatine deiminase family protein [Azospirillaceae bacterium]|nr:agmatine deiminase family protein [Azospirillaceae bacterium]